MTNQKQNTEYSTVHKKKYSKKKNKKLHRTKNKYSKKKHRKLSISPPQPNTQNQHGGTRQFPENLSEYYCNFLSMKGDATKVLHDMEQPRNVCIFLSKELTKFLYQRVNPLLDVVRNNILLPRFRQEQANPQSKMLSGLVEQMVDNNQRDMELYKNAFIQLCNREEGYAIFTPNDLQMIATKFYRFYLKGGTAMTMVVEHLQDQMFTLIRQQGRASPEQITEEDIIQLLGKRSDYDFNFVINPYLTEEEFNLLRDQSIRFLYEFFVHHIHTLPFFNNQDFKNVYRQNLYDYSTPLPTTEDIPRNSVFINPRFQETLQTDRLREVKSIRNTGFNLFSQVSASFINAENPLAEEQKGMRNTQFILIRLMTQMPLDTRHIPGEVRCTYPDGNPRQPPNVAGEMIDISIPIYTSVEKFSKWYESNHILNIQGIYVYDIYAIIHDLEIVIRESKQRADPGPKIEKRIRRLDFFQKLLCILPSILHANAGHLSDACSKVVETICKDSIQPYDSIDLEYEDSDGNWMTLPISPSYNLKTLSQTLVSIFQDFPESIEQSKRGNLSIFLLLKQFFYTYLTKRIIEPYNSTLIELYTPFQRDQNPQLHDLHYTEASQMKYLYYTLFSVSRTGNITQKIDLNIAIYQYIVFLLDKLETRIQTVHIDGIPDEDARRGIRAYMTKLLCSYLLEFNHMIVSTNDNTLMFDIISQFANMLIQLYRDFDSNPVMFTPQNNPTQFYIGNNLMIARNVVYERSLYKLKWNKQFIKDHFLGLLSIFSHSRIGVFERLGIPPQNYQYTIRGGFMYSIYKIMQTYIQHGNQNLDSTIQTNDLDTTIYVQLSTPADFSRMTDELSTYFKNAFTAYFTNVYRGSVQSKRISLSVRKLSEGHSLIQILLYDYIPLGLSTQSIFINTLQSVYPSVDINTLFRIFESHVFEVNIINTQAPVEDYHSIRSLGAYVSSSGERPWITLLNQLNEQLNQRFHSIFRDLGGVDGPNRINIEHLYFQDVYTMSKEYQQILYEGKDTTHKQKYIHRLLGTVPHEPDIYNNVDPVVILPMLSLPMERAVQPTIQVVDIDERDADEEIELPISTQEVFRVFGIEEENEYGMEEENE